MRIPQPATAATAEHSAALLVPLNKQAPTPAAAPAAQAVNPDLLKNSA